MTKFFKIWDLLSTDLHQINLKHASQAKIETFLVAVATLEMVLLVSKLVGVTLKSTPQTIEIQKQLHTMVKYTSNFTTW